MDHDDSQSASVEARSPWPSRRRTCGVLIALPLAVGWGLSVVAGQSLDARQAGIRTRVTELRDAASARRRGLVDREQMPGDAGVDYNGLRVALAAGLERTPEGWRAAQPALPHDLDEVLAAIGPGPEIDYVGLGDPSAFLELRQPVAPSPKARAEYERFQPALRYVRAGVGRERCDWRTPWESGRTGIYPNLLFARTAANLLAYEATLQPPRQALETGLELVAFGQDLERSQTLIGALVGAAARYIGYRSLGHTMGRAGLTAGDYLRALDVLERQEWGELAALFEGERLSVELQLLELGGRGLGGARARAEGMLGEYELGWAGHVLRLDFFQDLALGSYQDRVERGLACASLPRAQRRAAYQALQAEIASDLALAPQWQQVDLGAISICFDEVRLHSDATRALAAAHLVRLETGAFPPNLEALAARVSPLPVDPYLDGRALARYRQVGDLLLVYHVGRDGVDDLGAVASDDRCVMTRVPR